MPDTDKTYLERTIEDGHAKIIGDGKTQRIYYIAANHYERWADTVLLAGLKERMDAIEAMRNCCAHNRRPSKKVEENYLNARPLLDQLLDDYLTRWEYREPVEEMLWDRKAREAVEAAIDGADWDEETRTITFFDEDDDRMRTTVHSRDELDEHLRGVAETAFYAYASRDDGEFLVHCDEFGIVEAALADHEQRFEDFFRGQDNPSQNGENIQE